MNEGTQEKLKILADAAKYDVSCASSGSKRKNKGGLGNSDGMGICHSYTEDGRCVSLLKILLTNHCIFDCAYCVSRKSNDIKRAAFTVKEVVDLTINFYRRNYIEGLFLSSGIFKNADYTMERLVRIAKELRTIHKFNGYIHLKAIPGASDELIREAGMYADRLSVNMELPSEPSLKKLAPEKNYQEIYKPMSSLRHAIIEHKEEKKKSRKAPLFAPAGQSTQMIIGATPEHDLHILSLADSLYKQQQLRRVYYSGYVPVLSDSRLPSISHPPLLRENRLYQADWLLRFYGFTVNELVDEANPDLPFDVDPKLGYALRYRHLFPVDINRAEKEMLLRIPGVGVKSVRLILQSRRFGKVTYDHLRKMGLALNRAKYFISCPGNPFSVMGEHTENRLKRMILSDTTSRLHKSSQLNLFASPALT
ncbi:putative DNA modification/repair radical SAM protein [Roseivirga sp. BDSF3-8]|uniref:putative DNA modification/repair radical SAM protein n=1 Tax=Roseivirga sp. BDSF3-8 TaxID=3241598 RepID=UPI003531BD84